MATRTSIKQIFNRYFGFLNAAARDTLEEFTDEVYGRATHAITATADGTGTGLIDPDTKFGIVTSAAAANQISLPAATPGKSLELFVGANGCELISSVATHKVNNVVDGATNEGAVPANTHLVCTYVADDTWLVTGYNNLGAVITPIVPDLR